MPPENSQQQAKVDKIAGWEKRSVILSSTMTDRLCFAK
ncbi:MAG: hypothetical protein OFPII_03630 [Osedax symbiont Rs1]|nr:MAG: hypothetical protein OFPII_03630 [Osedax symbiont Rs1]